MKNVIWDEGTNSTSPEKHYLEVSPDSEYAYPKSIQSKIFFDGNLIGYATASSGGFLNLTFKKSIPLGNVRIQTDSGWIPISELFPSEVS